MIFELDADLPLVRLVSDEWVLQQLLCWGALCVVLHQTTLDETEKLFGPVGVSEEEVKGEKQCVLDRVKFIKRDSRSRTDISATQGQRACKD